MIKLKQFPKYPKEYLSQVSEPIANAQEAELVRQELEHMFPNKGALGVAAIQIGIPKRASLIKFPKSDEYLFICNPEIISSDKPTGVREGCLSFPKKAVTTVRFNEVKVRYQELIDGKLEERIVMADGLEAAIFQHEIDHMDGKTIYDRRLKIEPVRSNKVGRNEPCTCGSGIKYKKCCIDE